MTTRERNQAEEIYDYILAHEPASVYDIVEGTGWHEYVVETAIKLMLEASLIEQVGADAWGKPTYGYKRRHMALLAEIERRERELTPLAVLSAPPAQPSVVRYIPPEKVLTDEEVHSCAEAAIQAGLASGTLPPVEALMGLVTTDRQSIERVYAAIRQQKESLPW